MTETEFRVYEFTFSTPHNVGLNHLSWEMNLQLHDIISNLTHTSFDVMNLQISQPCISQCPASRTPAPCISGTGSINSDISLLSYSLYPGGPEFGFRLERKVSGLSGIIPAAGSVGLGTGTRVGTGVGATEGLGDGDLLDVSPCALWSWWLTWCWVECRACSWGARFYGSTFSFFSENHPRNDCDGNSDDQDPIYNTSNNGTIV
jgi:hypothetical protein